MSKYYITASLDNKIEYFAFDATTSITKSLSGSATSFPLSNGVEVADTYVNKNTTVRASGVISDVKTVERKESTDFNKTTSEFINKLEKIKTKGILFSIHFNVSSGKESGFHVINNCVFEALDITQDTTNGSTRQGLSSYRVSFTAKQLRFASGVSLSKKPIPVLQGTVTERVFKAPEQEAKTPENPTYRRVGISGGGQGGNRTRRRSPEILTKQQYDLLIKDQPEEAGRYVEIRSD